MHHPGGGGYITASHQTKGARSRRGNVRTAAAASQLHVWKVHAVQSRNS